VKRLLQFGQTRLQGTLGIIAVLHTWDQTLRIISSALFDSRRRSVFRSKSLDLGAQKLSVSGKGPEPGLSWKVSRAVTAGL